MTKLRGVLRRGDVSGGGEGAFGGVHFEDGDGIVAAIGSIQELGTGWMAISAPDLAPV